MKACYKTLSPRGKAQYDYRHGSGHDANPYRQGTPEHEQYMLEMGRLQDAELAGLFDEMKAGV
jgi:hypothetical protein